MSLVLCAEGRMLLDLGGLGGLRSYILKSMCTQMHMHVPVPKEARRGHLLELE